MGVTISKEELRNLPVETFDGPIYVIDRKKKAEQALQFLSTRQALGFDTETKPTFKRGETHKVALLQLATDTECFLFRLNRIGFPPQLEGLMCNPDIRKIGLSLRDDFAALHKRSDSKPQSFIDLQLFTNRFGIEDNSLQKIYAILFGKKISKKQRLSNWEAKTLTPAQQSYAAIDAWACLKIYRHLTRHSGDLL